MTKTKFRDYQTKGDDCHLKQKLISSQTIISSPSKPSWKLNAQVKLTEHGIVDYQREHDGLKSNFEPYIPCFKNREPGQITTFKRPN